ncbi:glycoside hydrolase superfamily [Umbelopsis sp. AD052]|nr:glycoside hydrolase superfamily [Umbelopsis sp. AD052]
MMIIQTDTRYLHKWVGKDGKFMVKLHLALCRTMYNGGSPIAKRSGTAWNYWTMKAWGANLGNWLILEKWMDSTIFDKYAPNANDEWTFAQQASNPAAALQEHWNSWITESDFQKLASVSANHVRIPVGYWAFIAPDSGEPYVASGQKAQIQRILGYCATYKINAIIDLHGLPGSQNGEAHSGHIGSINFYTDYNIQRSLKTVQAVVDWMNSLPANLRNQISSIEAANEPRTSSDAQLTTLKSYYSQAYTKIHASAYQVPMMFHDAFKGLGAWSSFLPPPANAVIDLHPYWAFPPNGDQSQIISQICAKASDNSFHLPVLEGEWSLASGVASSDAWLRKFMDTQVSVYQKASGAVMWALKNNINSDAWSFEQLISEGIINNGTFSLHTNAQC